MATAKNTRKSVAPKKASTYAAERALAAIERKDNVRRPHHYSQYPIEPIEFLVENGVPFMDANVIKYVMRHRQKNGVEDLKKARRYLDMMIKLAEGDPEWAK